MEIQKFAQKFIIYNPKKDAILVNKYLTSKYLPVKLINKFCLPGGQVAFGMSPLDSALQEVQEETGVKIKPWEILNCWSWTYKKDEDDKQICAIARIGLYVSGQIKPPKEQMETTLSRARWIKIKDLDVERFVFDEIPALKMFLSKYF